MAWECSVMLASPMTASSVTTSRLHSSFFSGNQGLVMSSSNESAIVWGEYVRAKRP